MTLLDSNMHALPLDLSRARCVPVDGALLFFDRDTGLNVRVQDERTRECVLLAPRAIQFDVPGGLSFEGTVNATGTQMTGTLSELSRRYGDILDKR